jgi:hypothetical protein
VKAFPLRTNDANNFKHGVFITSAESRGWPNADAFSQTPHDPDYLVMAITLIIEACYYMSQNELHCDVKGNVHIKAADIELSIQPDLDFDCR